MDFGLCNLFVFQIQLVLGTESAITAGWKKKEEKTSAAGEVKVHYPYSDILVSVLMVLLGCSALTF